MTLVEKILRADHCRKTRLHDEKGNLVPLRRMVLNGTRSYVTGFGRLLFGLRPEMPWISYDVISLLRRHLTASSRVLEFGSGMSTLWYAKHAAEVYSVESYEPWHKKISASLAQHGIRNVNYMFAATKAEYVRPEIKDQKGFDLIMVDGDYRGDCVRNSLPLLNPDGILYLDNSDKFSDPNGGDVRIAEELALEYARQTHSEVAYFTDFAPTQFTPNQGLMITRRVLSSNNS